MMEHQYPAYQESGKIETHKLVLSIIACIIISWILGYAYSVVTSIIPIIYINVVITGFLGFSLSKIIKGLGRVSHNRNAKWRMRLAIILGLLTNYFQWGTYTLYAIQGRVITPKEYIKFSDWLLQPFQIIDVMIEINQVGLWSFGTSGAAVNGSSLTAIWIVEFAIIFLVPIFLIVKNQPQPYSEFYKKWYPKYSLLRNFKNIAAVNGFSMQLAENPLETLQEMEKGTSMRHAKVYVFFLPDENTQYLTIENIFVEDAKKNKKDIEVVISNFSLNTEVAQSILSSFDHEKERLDIM